MRTKVGLIRVMTLTEETIINTKLNLERLYGELEVMTICLENQPLGVYDNKSFFQAIPKVVNAAMKLEEAGAKAVLINCAADPGLNEARRRVSIPVMSAGSSSALVAKGLGLPVGVIGILPQPPEAINKELGDLLIGTMIPAQVKTGVDISEGSVLESIEQCGKTLMQQGAKCLLLACTAMSSIGAAEHLHKALDIPVIDPLVISFSSLYHLITGLPALKKMMP